MLCPNCHIELNVVMEESMGVWFRCSQCAKETIRPDPNTEHYHPFWVDR